MQPLWSLTAGLGALWISSLLYVELISFWIPRWSCSWPDLKEDNWPVRVVLIADPQLTDRSSGSLRQFYSDIYMRRAFRSSVLGLEPDEIILLGDLFDRGVYLSDEEWNASVKRFEHIFDQSERGLKRRSKQMIPMKYVAGNRDLGYHDKNPQVPQRYKKSFGETEYLHKVGGVDFVVINAQTLDGGGSDESWSFIQQLTMKNSSDPRVLLTHIPLHRPDNTSCKPLVTYQSLRRTNSSPGKLTYQEYLTNATSHKLLNLIQPVRIFSGHAHDQCTVNHSISNELYTEETVGTFSWQQGNIYPSFLMLSVASNSSAGRDAAVSSALCFLPAQKLNYIWLAALFVITIVSLMLWPSQGIDLIPAARAFYNAIKGSESIKEKDEDAEYEMMWDAEGAMHLIRKLSNPTAPQAQSSERRGTAVQRAAAKAKASAAAEDVLDSDSSAFSSPNQRRMNFWLRRLYQVFGPVAVLIAVNLSLYMMLMMKDWA